MLIYKTTKTEAEKYIKAISLIDFYVKTKITETDINLFKLGFVDDIPCSLEIFSTKEQENQMLDILDDLEISARVYNYRQAEEIYQQVECLQTLLLNEL